MKNTFQVRIGRRGVITLPKPLRDKNRIKEGDILTLSELGDGVFILSPKKSRVDEVANKLAMEWREAGLTLDVILETLRDIRSHHSPQKS